MNYFSKNFRLCLWPTNNAIKYIFELILNKSISKAYQKYIRFCDMELTIYLNRLLP